MIDVVERVIHQIEDFRNDYLSLTKKNDSIDNVSMTDIVKRRYRQTLKDRDIEYGGRHATIARPVK